MAPIGAQGTFIFLITQPEFESFWAIFTFDSPKIEFENTAWDVLQTKNFIFFKSSDLKLNHKDSYTCFSRKEFLEILTFLILDHHHMTNLIICIVTGIVILNYDLWEH